MPNLLRDLSITEISLVDRPANRGALVALRKRDEGRTPGELALPEYRENTNPVWIKRKRSKMRFSDMKEMIAKREVPPDSCIAVYDCLVAKAEKDTRGQGRFAFEARMGQLLRQNPEVADYLQQHDGEMQRFAYEAVNKSRSQPQYDVPVEATIAKRAETVLRMQGKAVKTGTPEYSRAVAMVLEADPSLYRDYLDQTGERVAKLDQNRDYPGNDGDDGQDKEKRKRKSAKAKCKSSGDGMKHSIDDDDEDDHDDGADDDDDDDGKEKRKRARIAKALALGSLVLIRKGGKFTKLCQGCASENPVNAAKCGDCGKGF